MEKIIIVLWILFAIYVLVLFAILADLWSGVRKAKKKGIARTSYGFRRTVEKLAKYYNALLALTVIDCMQMAAIWYLETYYNYKIPMIPIVTIGGAIGIAAIEVKSIYEKVEDKVQYEKLGRMAESIMLNKGDWPEMARAIGNFLKDKQKNETDNDNT